LPCRAGPRRQKSSALEGIESVRQNAAVAEIDDQTDK
jgi:uncharacterized protein YegP (UPF0339 family)